jgi:diguanylate cyclase (GGDEF)-like protein/PAS domain S-box-containing protein
MAKALVIEDDSGDRLMLKRLLAERGHEVTFAAAIEEGLQAFDLDFFPFIILGSKPKRKDSDFIRQIRKHHNGDQVYILVGTAQNRPEDLQAILDAGANDYLAKPYDPSLLSVRLSVVEQQLGQILERKHLEQQIKIEAEFISTIVETAPALIMVLDSFGYILRFNRACQELTGYTAREMIGLPLWQAVIAPEEAAVVSELCSRFRTLKSSLQAEQHWITRKGEHKFVAWTNTPLFDARGRLNFIIAAGVDLTERRRAEQKLADLALHDPLTKLFNRNQLEPSLQRAIDSSQHGISSCLLYIDLDNFKIVNDTVGHAAGDRLLLEVSRILKAAVRPEDVIVRFGGDEFVVVLMSASLEESVTIAEHIRVQLQGHRFVEGKKNFRIGSSIGLAKIEPHRTFSDLLANADSACYAAKARGRNRVEIYHQKDDEVARLAVETNWAETIQEAMLSNQLPLWFQPVVRISDRSVDYLEVLLRYYDTEKAELISPAVFLPSVERSGQAPALDRYITERAFQTLAMDPELRLGINLSGKSLGDPGLVGLVEALTERYAINPARVIFEITETALIPQMAQARSIMTQLRKHGFKFALDDFGAGFSSLVYLKDLPLDHLKIDGCFVRNLPNEPFNQALIRAVVDVAEALELVTVAEYVDRPDTLDLLKTLGVDCAQGYLIGKPSDIPDMAFN